jgi:hypothetical protein
VTDLRPCRQVVEGLHRRVKHPIVQPRNVRPLETPRRHVPRLKVEAVGRPQGRRKVVAQEEAVRDEVGAGKVEDTVFLQKKGQ